MLLRLSLNQLVPHMTAARVECVYVTAGQDLAPGHKLLDVSVDLGSAFSQDCPPVSFYRLVAREKAKVMSIGLKPGDLCELGSELALMATAPEDELGSPPSREFRVAAASIVYHDDMWSGAH